MTEKRRNEIFLTNFGYPRALEIGQIKKRGGTSELDCPLNWKIAEIGYEDLCGNDCFSFIHRSGGALSKTQFAAVRVDPYAITFFKLAGKNFKRQRILNQTLNGPLQRAGAVNRIVAFVGDNLCRRLLQRHLSVSEIPPQAIELNFHDRFDFFAAQALKMMISSTRFRNSGLNASRNASLTRHSISLRPCPRS